MENEYNIFSYIDFIKKTCKFSATFESVTAKPHKHSFWEFVLLDRGSIHHTLNEKLEDKIEEGSIILIKPNDSHSITTVKKHRLTDLYANNNEFIKLCDLIGENVYPTFLRTNALMMIKPDEKSLNYIKDKLSLIQYYQKINDEKSVLSVYIPLLAELISLFWNNCVNARNDEDQKFYDFLAKIGTAECVCSPLEKIVELSGYSHSHLCKIFKQKMGKTLKDYHNQLKIDYAISLLSNSTLSVLEISNILGYSSLSHFIKIFKLQTAFTPKQYRKQLILNSDYK